MDTDTKAKHLWNAFRNGDSAAFSEMYTRYFPELMPYILKICRDRDLAFDAIHNTYVYLWQHKERLGEVSSLKFYLLRAVRHECISLLKRQNESLRIHESDIELELRIEPEDLIMNDNTELAKEKLKQALAVLSNRQREIIYLKFYNNLDYEEIAELLNLNYQSVVNSIHRSMLKLRNEQVLSYFVEV